jgi:hypothetical protein
VTIDAGVYERLNEPIEHDVDFTQAWTDLALSGLTFDINSIRVVEYTSEGVVISETPSQFEPALDYDANTNANGTVIWIMTGTTEALSSRYYYIYFDSTANPKSAPGYLTDLNWNSAGHILSNTYFDATIGTVLSSSQYRTGINTLLYNDIAYTDASIASGAGIYYLSSTTSEADTYEPVINGPVKKTIKITPAANGEVSFTLYDLSESIKAEGVIGGSGFSFSLFPYAHGLNSTTLSSSLYYYNGGSVVNETTSSGWLADTPDEGWTCMDGSGANKDFCLVTDSDTLASSNNFWRVTATRQLMLPAWNPNPTFPVNASSWIVMGDTYQDGRDFWNRLSAPIVITQGAAEAYQPTGVILASFTAEARFNTIEVSWSTASEKDLIGFNLYRAESSADQGEQLNDTLIPAKSPGSVNGNDYLYIDQNVGAGESYTYWLEIVGIYGTWLRYTTPVEGAYAVFMPITRH